MPGAKVKATTFQDVLLATAHERTICVFKVRADGSIGISFDRAVTQGLDLEAINEITDAFRKYMLGELERNRR